MGTALIPLAATDREASGAGTSIRPRSDFVALLIAASVQAPQTRARRRAEPEVAVAAYRVRCRQPPPAGRALSRSL